MLVYLSFSSNLFLLLLPNIRRGFIAFVMCVRMTGVCVFPTEHLRVCVLVLSGLTMKAWTRVLPFT